MPKKHEDHIADQSYTSMTHYNLVHKFFPLLQAMPIPDATAGVDKEWKKFETIPAWQLENVQALIAGCRCCAKRLLVDFRKYIYRLHVEPRVKLDVLEEETFPIPLKYIDVTYKFRRVARKPC